MSKRVWILVILTILGLLMFSACARNEEPQPQEQQQNQQQAENKENQSEAQVAKIEDQAPEGCVSCHKKIDDEKDYRIGVSVNKIEGHPKVNDDATSEDCIVCHKSGGPAPEFTTLLHKVHLVEGRYLEKYSKNCINCHTISNEGEIATKGYKAQ